MVYKSVKQQKLDDERKKENAKLACRRYRANMSEEIKRLLTMRKLEYVTRREEIG